MNLKFRMIHTLFFFSAGLPRPTVDVRLRSSSGSGSQKCLKVEFSVESDTISCLAGVAKNLLIPHNVTNVTLLGDGGVASELGRNLTQPLHSATRSRTFTCKVCIDIKEARIFDYCSSTSMTVSGEGEYGVQSYKLRIFSSPLQCHPESQQIRQTSVMIEPPSPGLHPVREIQY